MKFYKVIKSKEFIGVCSSSDMRRHQKKHNLLLSCDESKAEYVQCAGKLFRTKWMKPVVSEREHQDADIIEITENEYRALLEGDNISLDAAELQVDSTKEQSVDPIVTTTIEYLKVVKIKEMSNACNSAIEEGFSIGDDHYSMTIYDQLNILSASNELLNGASSVLYHADGQPYREYATEEIREVIDGATEHRNKHLMRFGAMKEYIESMNDFDLISGLKYTDEI